MPSSEPQSILLVRLSAIGDVTLSTSLLPGLRARYPQARLVWLTEPLGAEVLGQHPLIDEVWTLPRSQWQKQWRNGQRRAVVRAILALRRRLRAERFDLAVDIQGLMKSGIWTRLSGARRRVSLEGREGSSWLMHEVVRDPAGQGGELCREYRVLADYLGLPGEVFGMSLHPTEAERSAARERIAAAGSPQGAIALFPFTTRPQKHWFDERWAELATALHQESGHSIWILGGPGDLAQAERIADLSRTPVHILAGPSSNLREKQGFIAEASACVGVDTGLTHMSLGLGRPTVALFGSTQPYAHTGPVPGRVFWENLPCAPCRKHPTCAGRFTCMREHEVGRVRDAVLELLETPT